MESWNGGLPVTYGRWTAREPRFRLVTGCLGIGVVGVLPRNHVRTRGSVGCLGTLEVFGLWAASVLVFALTVVRTVTSGRCADWEHGAGCLGSGVGGWWAA